MRLILFDFDGVLVDTLSICFSLNAEVHDNLSMEEYKSFFEENIYDAIKSGKTKSIPDFEEKYRARTREMKIPRELKTMVQGLSFGHVLAIISSTPTSSIKNILAREGCSPYFKDILGSDIHNNKVIKIKALLEKYKAEPEETVYVTDTVGDILEARECGVPAIAVTWGFHDEKTLQKAAPAKIVGTPEELEKAIKEIL